MGGIHHIPISPLLFEVKTIKNAKQFSYKFMLSEILVLLNSNRNYVNI